jgi:hypothetical protein
VAQFSVGVNSAWGFFRWLVILLLVLDQLSAPFHGHHHDGLPDLHAHFVSEEHAQNEAHVEAPQAEHPSHALLTLRAEPRLQEKPLSLMDLSAVVALVSINLAFDDGVEGPSPYWSLDRDGTDFRSHRSLPPAGRAPPTQA